MYKCIECKKTFETNSGKWKHDDKYHKKPDEPEIINDLQCQYCKFIFTRKDSLKKHNCKLKSTVEMEQMKKQIKLLENKLLDNESPKNKTVEKNTNFTNPINIQIANNTNSNSNSQITNAPVINIISPMKEDLSVLTRQEILTILNNEIDMIKSFIQIVNFNPRLPQYHSIKNKNLHGEYVTVFNDELKTDDNLLKKHFFQDLFTNSYNKLKPLYNKHKNYFTQAKKSIIEEKMATLQDMSLTNSAVFKSYLKLINSLTYDNTINPRDIKLLEVEEEKPKEKKVIKKVSGKLKRKYVDSSDDGESSDIDW